MGIISGTELTFDGQLFPSPLPVTSTIALPTGGFVVVWLDSAFTVHLEKFDSAGTRLSVGQIAMDVTAYDAFLAPTLAVLASGDIAVTWTALGIGGLESDVLFQLVDSDLTLPASPPVTLNTTGGEQVLPQITALDSTGGLAITWFGDAGVSDMDVWAQVRPPAMPIADIPVNTMSAGYQGFSTITGLGDSFAVTWIDVDNDDIYVRVFDDDGTGGTEAAVGAIISGVGGIVGSTALASGGFVTAWSGETSGDLDGIGFKIFDDGGVAQSAVIEANTSTDGIQILSSVTALATGGFVVAWSSCGCSGSGSALAIFEDDGSVRQTDIVLEANSDTIPTVKALADDSFVAAWVSGDFATNDLALAIRVFNEDGSLRYTDDVDLDDSIDILPVAPLEIAALDNGGFVVSAVLDGPPFDIGPSLYSHVFDINREAPTSANSTMTVLEGASHVFALGNFPFSDVEQDALTGIQITSVPLSGILRLNGAIVSSGQTILPADVSAGKLVWTPAAGASGNGLASFGYRLVDDGGTAHGDVDTSSTYSITLNVTRVNDAPSAANVTRTTLEDVGYVFSAGSFGFADGDGDALSTVTITALPAKGALPLAGQAVAAGQPIAVADITAGKLVWTPPANANGATLASLSFKVQDSGGTANGGADTSGIYTLKFDVTAVNDAPLLNYQGPATTAENAKLKLDVLVDASDIDGGSLAVTDTAIISGFGKVTIGKNGTLLYDPTKAPNQDIAEGESRTVTVSYTISDGQGGKTMAEIDITVEGISPDIFRGTPERDDLTGTSGADRLFGLADKDRLDGRGGDDMMKGGKNADVFVFGSNYGRDTIVDFKPAKGDRIDLSNAEGINGFGDLISHHAEDAGKKVVITADDGSVLILKGVDLEDLDQSNFLF